MIFSNSILISAAEPSAEEHAAKLINELQLANSSISFFGLCSPLLSQSGVEMIVDASRIGAVMGFGDVIRKIFTIRKGFKALKEALYSRKPDLLLIIDFPDFNLKLAQEAHKLGIPVFYFIPPKIWAWRSSRAKLLQRYITQAAYIFPHEEAIAQKLGFTKGVFVGHPYANDNNMTGATVDEKRGLKEKLGFSANNPLLALFAGSRRGEIERHLPALRDAVSLLTNRHPSLSIAVAKASGIETTQLESLVPANNPQVKILAQSQHEILKAADAGLIKSGTSTLQAAFYEMPFSMFFKAPAITAWIVRCFVSLKEFSLVNIIRPHTIKEMLQDEVEGEKLAAEAERLLFDDNYRKNTLSNLSLMKQKLKQESSSGCAYRNTSKLILSLLDKKQ